MGSCAPNVLQDPLAQVLSALAVMLLPVGLVIYSKVPLANIIVDASKNLRSQSNQYELMVINVLAEDFSDVGISFKTLQFNTWVTNICSF